MVYLHKGCYPKSIPLLTGLNVYSNVIDQDKRATRKAIRQSWHVSLHLHDTTAHNITVRGLCEGHNGKYWALESDGSISASQSAPQPFIFEFRAHSKMAIKAPNGCYIRGEQNGIMSATSKEFDKNKTVMWEY